MLPSCAATTPMPLAVSIELPPPIATRPSQPAFLYSAAPASMSSTGGLALTRPKTTGSQSDARRDSRATSSRPAALTPGSVTRSGRRMPSSDASAPSSRIAPRRCTSRVGLWYVRSVCSSMRSFGEGGRRGRPRRPGDYELLFNRDLVVDARQVDALVLAHDARDDVDHDRDHVRGDEVVRGVQGRRPGDEEVTEVQVGPVQVGAAERPLVQHVDQEESGDHADDADRRDPGNLPRGDR